MKKFLIALALASLACCAWGVEPQTNPNIDHGLRTNPSVIPSAVRATWRAILSVPEKTENDAANASRDSYASSSRSIGDAMDSSQNALASAAYGYSSDTRSISAAMDNSQNALASSAADYASGTRAILTTLTTAVATGTSGTKVPLLDGANTWSATQTMSGLVVDTNTLYVDEGQNRVGVGTSTPQTGIHFIGAGVSSSATFRLDTTSNRGWNIRSSAYGAELASSGYHLVFEEDDPAGNDNGIWFKTGHGSMCMLHSGNVGIGTTTPGLMFEVASSTSIRGLLTLLPIATPPAVASEGMIYTDTDHHLYYYNGSTWLQLDNAP